jgi:hypothetical protein
VPVMIRGQREHMSFGTWIDSEGLFFDTTHFPTQLKKFPFDAPGCYRIEGKIVIEYDFPMIEVSRCTYLETMPDPRYEESTTRLPVGSRDNLPYKLSRAPYPNAQARGELFKTQNQKY